jgi:uncharacterized protein YodC (DUF2158 family)
VSELGPIGPSASEVAEVAAAMGRSVDVVQTFCADIRGEEQPRQLFVVGDVVTLKSGGPRMTVCALGNENAMAPGLLRCDWFDDGSVPHTAHYDAAALRIAPGCKRRQDGNEFFPDSRIGEKFPLD